MLDDALLREALLREAEVLSYEVLGRPVLPALQAVADLARDLIGSAMAEVNAVTSTHTVHLATSDRHSGRVPVTESFCSRVVTLEERTLLVPDAALDDRFRSSPYVDGRLASIVSYAGTQLRSSTGVAFGTLCVWNADYHPLTEAELRLLERLGEVAALVLEQHRDSIRMAHGLQRLADSHRYLDTSNESLTALAGQLGHDLRSPLASLRLSLSLIAERPAVETDQTAARLTARALQGSERMARTITELLEFALTGGAERDLVDLNSVLAEVLEDLTPIVSRVHVLATPLPPVWGHRSSMAAVLQNLISNAVKFSHDESRDPEVRITGERRDGRVRICVDDNGPGVPEELRSKVFESGERGIRTDVEGHGIGLATCARVLRHLGGTVGVEASPLGGASFWFELPDGRPRSSA